MPGEALLARVVWLVVLVLGCRNGCSCRPDIPVETDDDSADTGDTLDTDTGGDTAPVPPCDAPEVEPNGSLETSTLLPLETQGCGDFGQPLDLDFWRFSMDSADWLGVQVQARSIGSYAHPSLLLSSDSGDEALVGFTGVEDDIWLVLPALAEGYQVLLTEDSGQGDDEHYRYEVLAGVQKQPVEWNLVETGGEDIGDAQALADGDAVFGGLSDRWDQDWYVIPIPAGKHALTLDVDAWEFGSAGDYRLVVYDGATAEEAEVLARIQFGPEGWENDPWGEVASDGDEDLWVKVEERNDRSGRAYWYLLKIDLESSQ
jgi:hypothetical protein